MNTVIQDRGKTIDVAEGGAFHMLHIVSISLEKEDDTFLRGRVH